MSPLAGNPVGPLTIYPGQMQYFFGGPTPYAATETGEVLTQGAKSITLVVPGIVGGRGTSQRQITWSTLFPSAPTSVTVTLQGAIRDVDAEYVQVDQSNSISGEPRTVDSNFTYFRILITAAGGGTNPTIICKARCM